MKTMQMVMCGILPCAMVLTGCVSNSEPTIITRWLTREVEVVKRDVARENDIILRETKKIQGEIAVLIEKGDFATARKMLCEAKSLGIANVDASLASVRYELLVKVVEEEGKAIKKRLIDAAESAMKTDSLKVCEEGRALLKNLPAEPVAAVSMSLALQAADKGVSPNLEARRQKMNAELLQLRRVLLARVEGWMETLRFRAALAVARKTGVDFSQELVWTESAFSLDGKGRIEPAVTKRIRAEYAHLVRMLKDGIQIDGNQKTNLLVGAVVSGRDAVAKWCLSELKVSIDAVSDLDNMKRTPLLWALAGSHVETVEVVWKNKPGLELVDANGDSALHYAVRRGDARDISLASAQNLIDRRNAHGRTPLYDAIDAGDVGTARKLLDAGAKFDMVDGEHLTPFAYACSRASRLELVELLCAKGAKFGERDFALAICAGSLPIAQWFVEKRHFNVNSDALKVALDARIAACRKTLGAKKASELTDGQVCALSLKKSVRDYLVRRGCVILP